MPRRPYVPVVRNLYSLPAHLCFAMIWAVPLTSVFWGTRAKRHPYGWIFHYVLAAGITHGASNIFVTKVSGWPLFAGMVFPLAAMVLLGRYFLKKYADQSPFKALAICPFCGRAADPKGPSHCRLCGSPLAQTFFRTCSSCEGPMPPNARFCQHCGVAAIGVPYVP